MRVRSEDRKKSEVSLKMNVNDVERILEALKPTGTTEKIPLSQIIDLLKGQA